MNLYEAIKEIRNYDVSYINACKENWGKIAKPLYSLGKFEDIISQIGEIQKTDRPKIDKRRVLVFAGDNGVVCEGVSQSDHFVTTAVVNSMILDQSNVNIFSKIAKAEVEIYDLGMIDTVDASIAVNKFIVDKLVNGSKNLAIEPAMTKDECIHAIEAGINAAIKAKKEGCEILVIGEMGIGNTTTSAAILSILAEIDPEFVTGRGSGLSDVGLQKKINVIKRCIENNKPDKNDPIDVLSKAGGFDIAGMCGVIIGASTCGLPVILDGFISCVAALVAATIDERCKNVLIPSHISKEPGGKVVLEKLGLEGIIDANMALGEGTGGVALIPLLDMAFAIYNGDHSFESINIDAYTEQH